MAYTGEVIRYLRRKDATGFNEPISWLGAEQRFVGALRNSGINNLEEQYVLGTDTYTVTYEDSEGNTIIEKSFCVTGANDLSDVTDYYKVITTIYKEVHGNEDFFFEDDAFKMSNSRHDSYFGDGSSDYPDLEAVYLLDNQVFTLDNSSLKIYPKGFAEARKDELYFVKQGQPDLLVLTKLTGIKYNQDGHKVVREKIINALNPS